MDMMYVCMFGKDHSLVKVPITDMTNEMYKEFHKTKQIKVNRYRGRVLSTVLLGWPHSLEDDSFDYLFETILFPAPDDSFDERMMRYKTYEEALEGHKRYKKVMKDKYVRPW